MEDRVSRTQFQYSLEDADREGAGDWVPRVCGEIAVAAGTDGCGERSAGAGAAGAVGD